MEFQEGLHQVSLVLPTRLSILLLHIQYIILLTIGIPGDLDYTFLLLLFLLQMFGIPCTTLFQGDQLWVKETLRHRSFRHQYCSHWHLPYHFGKDSCLIFSEEGGDAFSRTWCLEDVSLMNEWIHDHQFSPLSLSLRDVSKLSRLIPDMFNPLTWSWNRVSLFVCLLVLVVEASCAWGFGVW